MHDAVAAIKLGATDFFEKPLNRERVLVSVRNSIRTARLNRTVEQMRGELETRYEMIGTSAPNQKLFQDVDKVAPTRPVCSSLAKAARVRGWSAALSIA